MNSTRLCVRNTYLLSIVWFPCCRALGKSHNFLSQNPPLIWLGGQVPSPVYLRPFMETIQMICGTGPMQGKVIIIAVLILLDPILQFNSQDIMMEAGQVEIPSPSFHLCPFIPELNPSTP